MGSPKPSPDIPEAPSLGRHFQFYPLHIIGMLLMLAIPVLALFGVFGRTMAVVSASNAGINMHIEFPQRMRYKEVDAMEITLTNGSGQFINSLIVTVDRRYIEQFTDVSFTPDASRITDAGYEVELTNVQAGETRVIVIQLRAEGYAQLNGVITVSSEAFDPFVVPFETFVFP